MAELQAVALFLECVLSFCFLDLYFDSQAAINTCILEVALASFWGLSNDRVDAATGVTADFLFYLPMGVCKHFLITEDTVVSGNACHFVKDIFQSAGPGHNVVPSLIVMDIDWNFTTRIWHLDSYLFAGSMSWKSSSLCSYLIKAVHEQLLVTVRKRLYNKGYPGVLCLLCGKVELLDYIFTCGQDVGVQSKILAEVSMH
ncbi:hypothetical protein G9A89_015879 [Geosiphon pyriformis]|nr:hypothetical protein G9A89_015879 [Geosiphon pyriformis]